MVEFRETADVSIGSQWRVWSFFLCFLMVISQIYSTLNYIVYIKYTKIYSCLFMIGDRQGKDRGSKQERSKVLSDRYKGTSPIILEFETI